jgi:hypothetical protein
MKVEFSQQVFKKYSNLKFSENPFNGSRVVSCERTDGRAGRETDTQMDRHKEATSRFSQFC